MPTYNCECCHFTTLLKSNHTNHLLTKKHIRNSQIVSPKLAKISFPLAQISPTVYPCKYCDQPFKHKSSLSKHIKYSCTKNKRARTFGGKEEITLKANEKLINITWKESNMWVLTEDTLTHIKYFRENSSWGVWEGEIIVK